MLEILELEVLTIRYRSRTAIWLYVNCVDKISISDSFPVCYYYYLPLPILESSSNCNDFASS